MVCVSGCFPSTWNVTCWRDFCFKWTTVSRPDAHLFLDKLSKYHKYNFMSKRGFM